MENNRKLASGLVWTQGPDQESDKVITYFFGYWFLKTQGQGREVHLLYLSSILFFETNLQDWVTNALITFLSCHLLLVLKKVLILDTFHLFSHFLVTIHWLFINIYFPFSFCFFLQPFTSAFKLIFYLSSCIFIALSLLFLSSCPLSWPSTIFLLLSQCPPRHHLSPGQTEW